MNEEEFLRAWLAAQDEIGDLAWKHLSPGQRAEATYVKMRSLDPESVRGLLYLNSPEQVCSGADGHSDCKYLVPDPDNACVDEDDNAEDVGST